jgi:hypothetical protein
LCHCGELGHQIGGMVRISSTGLIDDIKSHQMGMRNNKEIASNNP